jgi:hypothetical protein
LTQTLEGIEILAKRTDYNYLAKPVDYASTISSIKLNDDTEAWAFGDQIPADLYVFLKTHLTIVLRWFC